MEYKWVVLSVTSVGVFMAGLDSRIVLVGLPTLGQELGIGVNELVWVTQAYVLVSTVLSLLFGRTGDQFGRVKLYNIGFAVFTAGSALASISYNGYELIASRAVQGVGSAMLLSNSGAMLTDVAKGGDLGTLIGFNQIAVSVGAVAGFTLSGIILSVTGWRALFYINIPVGIFGTYWAHRRLNEISVRDPHKEVDWPGFASFSAGLTLILVGITFLSYGVGDTTTGSLMLGAGVASMVLFVWIETRSRAPLLDLALFRNRSFASGNLAMLCNGLSWFGMTIFLSLYLQVGLGVSPLVTGLEFLPVQVAFMVVGPIAGRLTDRHGRSNLVSASGMVLMTGSMLFLLSIIGNPNPVLVTAMLVAYGIGIGMFGSPNRSVVFSSVPPDKRGVASGLGSVLGNMTNSASYGIVILLMTFAIPYGSLTNLIQGTPGASDPEVLGQFFGASRFVISALTLVTALGVIPALLTKAGEKAASQSDASEGASSTAPSEI